MSGRRRLALVTGSTAGLGVGIAERLAQTGCRVQLTHRPGGTPPDAALARVRVHDPDASSSLFDARVPESAAQVVRELEAERGFVDILVHAVGPMRLALVENSDFTLYSEMVAANLGSAVALSLAILPKMRSQGFGRLVFFGLNGSGVTRPARGLACYGAAKAGLEAFARTVALEEAQYGITSNIIEPGDIREKFRSRLEAKATPAKNPTGHAGSWEDIADAVGYFVSDAASFVNGAILSVGGGLIDAHE